VAHYVPSPESASPWTPESPEARRLADALRYGRLSVLSAEAGAGKTTLLHAGVLPLLGRRAFDGAVAAARAATPTILPFPERRSAARARLAELVVFFDAWDDAAPLLALHQRIDAALRAAGVASAPERTSLPERVRTLGERYGTRLLFIFDGFDEFLRTWNPSAPDLFADELVQLLTRRLPANVLIALRPEAQALLEPLSRRLFNVDAEVLALSQEREAQAHSAASLPAPQAAASHPAGPGAVVAGPAAALHPDAIYADIARMLAQIHGLSGESAWVDGPALLPAASGTMPRAALVPAATAPTSVPRTNAPRRAAAWMTGLGALALAGLLAFLPSLLVVAPPHAPRADAPPTEPIAAAAAPASVDLLVDAEGPATPRLAAELARALYADGSIALRLLAPGDDETQGPQPHLAIVRYDALQAVARKPRKPTIAVVAPLWMEELYVVVRADSPLRYIHQIKGRRINIGPAGGARALTAQGLYRRMFGGAVPGTRDANLDAPAALERLATGRSLDAVILAEAQPAALWQELPPSIRDALRVLPLDPEQPASQRAVQAYLPTALRDANGPGTRTPTLASMAFLVTGAPADDDQSATLARFVHALCRSLPALQRGDAKWREVQPGLQFDTGWPLARGAEAAWASCGTATQAIPVSTRPR
jgi:TRAP-type uncharacterized transport system substrate-binding protein